jgi:hypothetical protein
MSEATAAPCNTASESPPAKQLWYAAAGVAGAFVGAADEVCEFFEVLPGYRPPTTAGRLGRLIFAYIRLGYTVLLDGEIPRESLNLRLEDRPVLKPVHTMNLILLGRVIRRAFRIGSVSALKITLFSWDFPIIGLEAGPLTG